MMAEGCYQGMDAHRPGLREMFTLESLMSSDWYRRRLEARQTADERLWRRHIENLEQSLSRDSHVHRAWMRAGATPGARSRRT